MDITLIRTFLEVAATGSFVNAADRLFVTQSAVSLRIQRLESTLGRPLFTRSKAGAELTAAGRKFERYALSITKVWQEAQQQIAIPEGFNESLSIGAQYSLWPRLGFRWIDALREQRPTLNIRAELGMEGRITRFLVEGVVQAALLYTPQLRPGLIVDKLVEDELIMVAAWENPTLDVEGRYVFIDWGPEFIHAHAQYLPHLTNPGLTLSLGALGAEYIRRRNFAGYLPARYIKRYIDAGQLHLVPDAPRFPYPVWAVWRDDLEPDLKASAHATLLEVSRTIHDEQESVLEGLEAISDETVKVLGSTLPKLT